MTGVGVSTGPEELQVFWTAVSGATGYKVEWKSGDEAYHDSRQAVVSGGETVRYTIEDLASGVAYTVRVIATKEHANDGAPSEEVTVIPNAQPPAQVTGVGVTPDVEQLDVSWAAVPDASGYKVQWKSGDEDYDEARQAVLTGGDMVSYTIMDLTPGTQYTVRVIAT